MLDKIQFHDNMHATVFDKPTDEYRELMLLAASDDHYLSKNYQKDIIKEMHFMVALYQDNIPLVLWGCQPVNGLPNNIARAYARFYYAPAARSTNLPVRGPAETFFIRFFVDYPQYHESLGIDTLFFTRNLKGKRRDRWIEDNFEEVGFKKLPEPRMYKGVPQYFFVQGKSNFVTEFPLALSGP